MLIAALLLLPGLGEFGLATRGEIPALDRALAELGVPRSGLIRSPWLPDRLRSWCFAAFEQRDWALRIPGALAAIGLVGLAAAWGRRLGWSLPLALLPPAFALALPLLVVSGRTVLGNPTGELWVSAAPLVLLEAADRSRRRSPLARVALLGLGVVLIVAAVASLGIVLGGCLPLALVALADVARAPRSSGEPVASEPAPGNHVADLPRPFVIAAWCGACVTGFVGLWLGWKQGEGYIPLLGAAKDLARLEDPTTADFSAALQAFGYQTFPFIGLLIAGMLAPGRARIPALWLGAALVIGSVWSLVYGPTPLPITVPAALLATAAIERVVDPREPIAARRLVVLLGVLGALIVGKDAVRTPELVAAPLLDLPALEFPGERLDAGDRLKDLAERIALVLVIGLWIALPSEDQLRWRATRPQSNWLRGWTRIEAALDRLLTAERERSGLARVRRNLPVLLVGLVLVGQSWAYGRVLLAEVGEQLSIAGPLRRWAAAVEVGELPAAPLGLHRIRDSGLDFYGPGASNEVFMGSRSELDQWLSADEPRVALIRRSDLASAHSSARAQGRALHVLDDRHWDYVMVANRLPRGWKDQNPLLPVVLDDPPQLAHATRVSWGHVELIGWEIEDDLHRGSHTILHMVFKVHRPLPTGTQMYARLQRGKLSRVGAEPHELTEGLYPPNYWRAGDYIHHRYRLEIPTVEVLPGEHELIVGMRRSEKSNLTIAVPEGDEGEFGVVIKGSKREFAQIGVVEIAW